MVGQAIQNSVSSFRGVRSVNPTRDMPHIGRLLNQAFRDEFDGELAWMRAPFLRDVSAYLWAASFMPAFPNGFVGFVWEQDGQLIGNVTMTPDEARTGYWLISNVAVAEKYRRQGIARALMQAALDEARKRNARATLLQVRPQNAPAIELYENLGFEIVDTATRYRRSALPSFSSSLLGRGESGNNLRRLTFGEHRALFQLAKDSLLPRIQTLRPLNPTAFALTWDDRIAEGILDFLSGQKTMRWGFYNAGRLDAALIIRAQRLSAPHSLEIFIRPEARGNLEAWMLAFALEQLADFPQKTIQIEVWSSHAQLVNAVQAQGFFVQKGLTLMLKEMAS